MDTFKAALDNLAADDVETVLAGIDALVALGRDTDFEGSASADALARCLYHPSKKVRMSATWALGMFKTPVSVHALTDLLEEELDPFLRATAAISLGETQQPEAMPILEILLQDNVPRVRANAVEAIARVGDPSSVSLLMPLLEDPNNRVRANVAMVLWKFGGLRMVSELHTMLKTSAADKWLRASAAWALGEIGGFESVENLLEKIGDEAPEVRRNAVKALGKIGDVSAAEKIVPLLDDEDLLVRENSVEALGALKACGALLKALPTAQQPFKMRIIAALENYGTEDALYGLVKQSREDESRLVRYAARKAALAIRTRAARAETAEEKA